MDDLRLPYWFSVLAVFLTLVCVGVIRRRNFSLVGLFFAALVWPLFLWAVAVVAIERHLKPGGRDVPREPK